MTGAPPCSTSASWPGCCCCRPRSWCAGRRRQRQRPSAAAPPPSAPGMTVGQALRSPQFIVLGLTFFACCAAHSGPIFHMVSYAMLCGVAADGGGQRSTASRALPASAAGCCYGVLADRLGRQAGADRRPCWSRRSPSPPISSSASSASSMRWPSSSAPPMAASCRSMPCWRANISASASWARCSAPRPCSRASAWRSGRWPAAGLRCLRQLFLAVHRLGHHRPRRCRHCHRLPAPAEKPVAAGLQRPGLS